ncbi:hypothetical protein [Helicobacter sp. 23-1045]
MRVFAIVGCSLENRGNLDFAKGAKIAESIKFLRKIAESALFPQRT